MSFGARAQVRLGALRHNFQRIKNAATGAQVMAVVKANAYGHGMVSVADALFDAGNFGVARVSEAVALRQAGIRQPIVLLSGVYTEAGLRTANEQRLDIVVHCWPQIELLEAADAGAVAVWLKVDTGMRRLGFFESEVADATRRLKRCPSVGKLSLMTHLASADDRDSATTREQFQCFRSLTRHFDGDISIGNSPGILGWPDEIRKMQSAHRGGQFWVRAGVALYGISPFPEGSGADLDLRPVMQFESRLIAVKALSKGERVGYGGSWRADRDTTLGLISVGYGDGYTRFLPSGTPVRINGRRAALAGVISMDIAAVDLGADADDKVGDPVVLWGEALPVEEVARHAGTIP